MPTVPLRRLVDDDKWEAEDLAGRLGIVAHAAFLRAGFVPYGDEPSSGHLVKQVDDIGQSAPSLSRRYTAAQLARPEGGADADVAVLELRARGDGDVAFQAYVLTRDGDRRCLCQAVLDEAALAPLLACRIADAARALETEEPAAMLLWRSLADWVFPVLLLELCRRNDLPVTGLASLPDDIKAEILKRLTDGKDLARVECASRQLRRLVAERDGELWKAMYEALDLPPEEQSSDSEGLSSWKKRYMEDRRRRPRRGSLAWLFGPYDEDEDWLAQLRPQEASLHRLFGSYDDDENWLAGRRHELEADLQHLWMFEFPSPSTDPLHVAPLESTGFAYYYPPYMEHHPLAPPATEQEVAVRRMNAARQRRKVQRNDYQKKRHGTGAIHSPSSRYKWKHR